jgi:hypothetical protein
VSSRDEHRIAEDGVAVDVHGTLPKKYAVTKVTRVHAAQVSTDLGQFCKVRKLPKKVSLRQPRRTSAKRRAQTQSKKDARDRKPHGLTSGE